MPSEEELYTWFAEGTANLAIVCGQASGGFVGLDFDVPRRPCSASARVFEQVSERIPSRLLREGVRKEILSVVARLFDLGKIAKATPVVRTHSGGLHIWLRAPSDPPVESFSVPMAGLEVKAGGRILVAPPSLGPSGQIYRFISFPSKILEVKDLVASLMKAVRSVYGQEATRIPSFTLGIAAPKSQQVDRWTGREPCIATILQGVREGIRNEAAIRVASFLYRRQGLDPEAMWLKMLEWNELNKPPLDERELRYVWKSEIRHGYVYGCRGMSLWCVPEKCFRGRRHYTM